MPCRGMLCSYVASWLQGSVQTTVASQHTCFIKHWVDNIMSQSTAQHMPLAIWLAL